MAELEQALIGAVCIDPGTVLPRILPYVASSDFADAHCAALFEAAAEAHSRGKAQDAVILADAVAPLFATHGEAECFVRECMDSCPTLANAEHHARLVHKAHRDRQLRSIIDRSLYTELDGDELAAALIGQCQDFLREEHSARTKTLCEALQSMYAGLAKQDDFCIHTGFPLLDATLKGLTPGSLTLIGARPSVGKSAFSEDLALTVARQGKPVLLFSMEMDAEELAERAAARESGVPLSAYIDHSLTPEQYQLTASAAGRMGKWPLHICDSPSVTPAKIRALARTVPGLALIIVDYIGLMRPTKANDSRNLELGAISRELKNLAAELKVPIVALCQLNRMADDTTRPTLSNIRDSGELEQNASKVIFLWNECKADKIVGVSVAKNRRGATGNVYMRFDGEHMTYKEIDYTPPQPAAAASRYSY